MRVRPGEAVQIRSMSTLTEEDDAPTQMTIVEHLDPQAPEASLQNVIYDFSP